VFAEPFFQDLSLPEAPAQTAAPQHHDHERTPLDLDEGRQAGPSCTGEPGFDADVLGVAVEKFMGVLPRLGEGYQWMGCWRRGVGASGKDRRVSVLEVSVGG
jgi:hypothetical protein